MKRTLRWSWWLLLLLVAWGCDKEPGASGGGGGGEARAPSERPRTPELMVMRDPQTGEQRRRARYALEEEPAREVRTDRALRSEDQDFARVVREAARGMRYDPCLARAAEVYGSYHPHGVEVTPPRAFQEFALHASGCPDSSAMTRLYFTTEPGRAGALEHLGAVLGEVRGEGYTHVGVGRAPGGGAPYRWTWTMLLVRRSFEMAPVSRAAAVGDRLRLRFELGEGLREPEVLRMLQGGEVESLPVSRVTGGYESVVPMEAPGEQWLEVMAEGSLGPEVVMLFPVYAGEPPPRAWEGWLPPDEGGITRPGEAERLMFELVNEDRGRYGLPALEWDERLAEVARGHSRDMAESGTFAHTSRTTGTLGDRLEALGYEARFSAENIARNTSIHDAQAGLMQSLGHRANLLSPEVTHLGIGVVMVVSPGAERALWITQNFARPVVRLSPEALRDYIGGELGRARREAGREALRRRSRLDAIADEAAERAVRRGFDGEAINGLIARRLEKAGVRYRRFRIQYHPILEASDVTIPKEASSRQVKEVGIGVAPMVDEDGMALSATLIVMVER